MEGITDLEMLKKDVGKKLRELAEKLGKDVKEVMELFKQEYSREDLKGYPEEVRLKYALRLTFAKSRDLLNTVRLRKVIPFALSPIKKFTNSSFTIFISCFLPETKQLIHLRYESEDLEEVRRLEEEVELFRLYEDVKVKTTPNTGVFRISFPETKLTGGKELNLDYDEFFSNIGIEKLGCLREVVEHVEPNALLIPENMKVVSGIVVRVSDIEARGVPASVYEIVDESLPITEEVVSNPYQVILPPTITVWCSQKFGMYDEGSDISVVGYLIRDRSGRVSMTGEFVYPNTIVRMRR